MSSKAKGGITKGKSHAEGGIPMVVKSTGQKVELEGGEGVINKKNMKAVGVRLSNLLRREQKQYI